MNQDWRAAAAAPTQAAPSQAAPSQAAPSQASTRRGAARRQQDGWIDTEDCVRSAYTKEAFTKGEIISLPFHVPNTNKDVQPNDVALTRTAEGPVYSKRRMAVVLWKHKTDMFCLPFFSFGARGITAKPVQLRDEYVEITNQGEGASHRTEGVRKVLEAAMVNTLKTKNGVVHITGGFRVSYQDDIAKLGRLTDESRARLTEMWIELNNTAQAELY
ncbi:uncharacterized protein MYCGRDRAFT_92771 [Zymoseptoria tritici IPO323]|nr:uncharacterized protein MYCGRDRAFT_92771 [Zymoseptoria tritici IPO323]EGP88079.1 hypothetical protein MYCGRDRAFT_92771 [Zymoseptoria tritici IPO323]